MIGELEAVVYLSCLASATWLVYKLARGAGSQSLWLTLGFAQLGVLLLFIAAPKRPEPAPAITVARAKDSYVGSGACRSCHPAEYDSWHASYHRSMTQIAGKGSLRAPWNQRLSWRGRSYELFMKGDEFWVSLPDPDVHQRAHASAPSVERQIVMTTGSHHYQAYWLPGGRGNELWQFPFVYHFESRRFIPRHDAFLQPPDAPPHQARWNSNCVMCHAVAGQPKHDARSDRFQTEVAELGIACEACHGPAARHVSKHRSPLNRYRELRQTTPDDSIVNPAKLQASKSAEVCGQCHAYFVPKDPETWWQSGFANAFVPGDSLANSRLVLDYARDRQRSDPIISASIHSIFFKDGTIRVGGREYNGLIKSACYLRGSGKSKLSCLSCHELHGDTPADQLRAEPVVGAHCLNCHAELRENPQAHTHHPAGSAGSDCYNCHMPYTTYALFKGIRSHRISSPNARASADHQMPNACNLCHLDKSLSWTAKTLERWYGQPALDASGDAVELPHAVVGLLQGDAALRVLSAYAMGWDQALVASGKHWQAPLLAELLADPYAAVRFVAQRSLGRLPGYADFDYDFIADRNTLLERRQAAYQRASRQRHASASSPELTPDQVQQLIAERDTTPISISE